MPGTRRRARRGFAAALSALCVLAVSASRGRSEGIVVTPVEGPSFTASTVRSCPEGFAFELAGGKRKTLANLEVIFIDFGPSRAPFEVAAPPHAIELVSGDVVRGRIVAGDESGVHLETAPLGRTFVSVDTISRIIFLDNLRPGDLRSFPLEDETDTIYRRTLAGRDVVTGVLLEFDAEGVTLDSAIGEYHIDFRDLLALTLLPQIEVKPTEELLTLVACRDGSSFQGILRSVSDDRILLTSRLDSATAIDLSTVESLSFRNGRFVFLSDLEPVSVVQTPFIGDPDDFLFPFRRDQSVGGHPLRIAGTGYSRGIGVHSRSELTYALDGKYVSFRTAIGIDDESLDLRIPGAVVFEVLVDGASRFESPLIRAGAAPVEVDSIDVRGARRLTLRVDFGDDRHFGDRADWAGAMLVR